MGNVVGKVIQIKSTIKELNRQLKHNTAAASGMIPQFRKFHADRNFIVNMAEGCWVIRQSSTGELIARATFEMQVCEGDIIITGSSTDAAVEFLIGGRVGISAGSGVVITGERSVAVVPSTDHARHIFRKGGTRSKNSTLNVPLEIQTNGGIYGIKG